MTSKAGHTSKPRGRPRLCPDDVLAFVVSLRASGSRLIDICNLLNAAGVATPGGGSRWWPSHVHRLLHTRAGSRLLTAAHDGLEPNASDESMAQQDDCQALAP